MTDVLTEPTDGSRSERAAGGDPEKCQERVLTEASQECVLLDVLTEPPGGGRPELVDGFGVGNW